MGLPTHKMFYFARIHVLKWVDKILFFCQVKNLIRSAGADYGILTGSAADVAR